MADLVFVEVGTELGLKNPHHFDQERTELEIVGNLAQIVLGSEHLEQRHFGRIHHKLLQEKTCKYLIHDFDFVPSELAKMLTLSAGRPPSGNRFSNANRKSSALFDVISC